MKPESLLVDRYPALQAALPIVPLCALPTPVDERTLRIGGAPARVWIKRDDQSGAPYGGNKLRKLEYLLGRSVRRGCRAIATFGAVGSNHALATAIYARRIGLDPVCLLSHQTRSKLAAEVLNAHLNLESELVPFGGRDTSRLEILRKSLWHRHAGVIPMGGSSWLGTVGFVNAGLELAAQIDSGLLPPPDRIYLATGTMGSAAGLAIGLGLAGARCELHAVRVSHTFIANETALDRLRRKTVAMLEASGADLPVDAALRLPVVWRHGYFAPGYARSNAKTDDAIALATEQLGLRLEATYTGKALAALLDDLAAKDGRATRSLFWNTYHSAPLPQELSVPADRTRLPAEFAAYLED